MIGEPRVADALASAVGAPNREYLSANLVEYAYDRAVHTRGCVVVKREKVAAEQGREWVDGRLDPDTYFAEVQRTARDQARRTIATRLARLTGLTLRAHGHTTA